MDASRRKPRFTFGHPMLLLGAPLDMRYRPIRRTDHSHVCCQVSDDGMEIGYDVVAIGDLFDDSPAFRAWSAAATRARELETTGADPELVVEAQDVATRLLQQVPGLARRRQPPLR